MSFDIQERPAAAPDRPHSDMAIVTPGYFRTMGIALLKGRYFSERDTVAAQRVLVVNQAFAQKYFPGEEVLGKRIEPGGTNGKEKEQMREIVGVVANAKQVALSVDPDPIYYFPYKQLSWTMGAVVLRTSIPPIEVAAAARHVLADLDPQAPMYRIRTGQDLSSTAIARPRFQMVLMGTFAAVALILTIGGLTAFCRIRSRAVAVKSGCVSRSAQDIVKSWLSSFEKHCNWLRPACYWVSSAPLSPVVS